MSLNTLTYDEQYNDTFVNNPIYTDWVSTNKTDGNTETESIVYRVIEPGTGREISSDLEKDEAAIISNSRELYEAVDVLVNGGATTVDAIAELIRVFKSI